MVVDFVVDDVVVVGDVVVGDFVVGAVVVVENVVVDCVVVTSPGLDSQGNSVGAPARFTVETFSAGRGDLDIEVTNPDGVVEHVSSFSLLPLSSQSSVANTIQYPCLQYQIQYNTISLSSLSNTIQYNIPVFIIKYNTIQYNTNTNIIIVALTP